MNLEQYITPENLYIGTFFVCFVSGFIPVVNAEAAMLAVSAMTDTSAALGVTIMAAGGQMLAKSLLYFAGLGVLKLPIGKMENKLAETREKFQAWQGRSGLLVFISAVVGLPPFYVISILAGTVGVGFPTFVFTGFAGRFLRFGILFFFPQLIKTYLAS